MLKTVRALCGVRIVGGLGMRVVGGKLGADKKLGTYVSTVVAGGVADKAGIVKGDTLLSLYVAALQLPCDLRLHVESVDKLYN